jgi:hypothetical protein
VTVTRAACGAGGELPAVTAATYANGKLKVRGTRLGPDVTVEINGRPVLLPVVYRADKGVVRVRGAAFDLNIRQPGVNTIVLRTNGRASLPFAF